MQTFRKGDIVSVRGTVKHDQGDDDRIFVDVIGSGDTLWMKPDDMTLIQEFVKVGDTVCWEGGIGIGKILAIADGHAWIGLGDGDYCTRFLTALHRVPTDGESSHG